MNKVSELIKEFESRIDPNSILVKNGGDVFEVYPWIKPMMFSIIQTGNKPQSGNSSKSFQLKQFFSGWRYISKKTKTIIFSNSLERRELEDGIYDKLFHSLSIHETLKPSKTIETKFPSNFFSLREYKNVECASRSIFYFKEFIYGKLFLRRIKVEGFEPLKKFLNELEINVNCENVLRKNIAQYRIMRRYFRRHPHTKYVFLSVGYTNFGLIRACKELGIFVIELQHGVINDEHFGYSYTYIPNENQFPDYILTFGDEDKTFVERSPLRKYIQPFSVGSFIINYYLHNEKHQPTKGNRKVAVSLQDCSTGVNSIQMFIDLAKKNPDVQFYFKRRRMSKSFYEDLYVFPANVLFEEKKNIYELILSCSIHITSYSSCALEAPSLGRPNIFYNRDNKASEYYMEKLPPGRMNIYCDTLDDMDKSLKEMLSAKLNLAEIRQGNSKNIKSNYSINIDTFVQKLCEK